MDGPRFAITTVVAVACLAAAAILGVLAFFVPGGFWLVLLAALFVLAAIAVDRLITRSTPLLQALAEPLVLLALLAVLAIGTFAVISALTGTSTHQASPRTEPPSSVSAPPPATSPPAVAEPAAVQGYVTAGADVHLRAAATTDSPIITTMARFATPLTLSCYQEGESVFSDPYWYRVDYGGRQGYVSELWLDTGSQPTRTGVPHC